VTASVLVMPVVASAFRSVAMPGSDAAEKTTVPSNECTVKGIRKLRETVLAGAIAGVSCPPVTASLVTGF